MQVVIPDAVSFENILDINWEAILVNPRYGGRESFVYTLHFPVYLMVVSCSHSTTTSADAPIELAVEGLVKSRHSGEIVWDSLESDAKHRCCSCRAHRDQQAPHPMIEG
jgi:hypothetical protein